MKLTVNKRALTVEEYEKDVPQFREEWNWLGKSEIEQAVRYILDNQSFEIISYGSAEISKNHYRMCVYVSDVVVSYTDFTKEEAEHYIAVLGFDLTEFIRDGETGSYRQIYKRIKNYCC